MADGDDGRNFKKPKREGNSREEKANIKFNLMKSFKEDIAEDASFTTYLPSVNAYHSDAAGNEDCGDSSPPKDLCSGPNNKYTQIVEATNIVESSGDQREELVTKNPNRRDCEEPKDFFEGELWDRKRALPERRLCKKSEACHEKELRTGPEAFFKGQWEGTEALFKGGQSEGDTALTEGGISEGATCLPEGLSEEATALPEGGPSEGATALPEGGLSEGTTALPEGLSEGATPLPKGLSEGATALPEGLSEGATALPEGGLSEGATTLPEGLSEGATALSEGGLSKGATAQPEGPSEGATALPEGLSEGATALPEGLSEGATTVPEGGLSEGATALPEGGLSEGAIGLPEGGLSEGAIALPEGGLNEGATAQTEGLCEGATDLPEAGLSEGATGLPEGQGEGATALPEGGLSEGATALPEGVLIEGATALPVPRRHTFFSPYLGHSTRLRFSPLCLIADSVDPQDHGRGATDLQNRTTDLDDTRDAGEEPQNINAVDDIQIVDDGPSEILSFHDEDVHQPLQDQSGGASERGEVIERGAELSFEQSLGEIRDIPNGHERLPALLELIGLRRAEICAVPRCNGQARHLLFNCHHQVCDHCLRDTTVCPHPDCRRRFNFRYRTR